MAAAADHVFDDEALDYGWLTETRPLGERPDWQRKNPEVTEYNAERTISFFHLDSSPVRGLLGPLGSGKSTGCCLEIMMRACVQPVDDTGKRRSRWAVIRNTYRELHDTTLQTWLDWFPEEQYGEFSKGDMTHMIRVRLPDGTELELDVMFRALDRPKDIKKLLSLELTAAWVNEAREIPKAIVDMLQLRIGRFPSYRDPAFSKAYDALEAMRDPETGAWPNVAELDMVALGGYWSGLIMDTNPPDEDHWWYRVFEEERPPTWKLFRQPSGRSPQAENLRHLKPGYYQQTAGKTPEWIKVYFDGEYGFVLDGKPVYPEFTDSFHCTDWAEWDPTSEIRVGIDFGLTPAAVFVQQDVHGRWKVIDELVAEDMGIARFAELLNAKIQRDYRDSSFRFFGDPAGDQRAQTDENTPFKILRANGIPAVPARTNDFNLRREAVAGPLMKFVDGRPGLAIHPRCRQLRKGMAGKYQYRRVQIVGDERYHDKPDKGMYSHVCDALQYAMLEFGSNPGLSKTQQQLGGGSFIAGGLDKSPFDFRLGHSYAIKIPFLWGNNGTRHRRRVNYARHERRHLHRRRRRSNLRVRRLSVA